MTVRKAVNQLVNESEGEEQALYVLLGATGLRISEALALETRHLVNGGRTIEVRQQVHRRKPVIVPYLKTDAGSRDVDVNEEVAEYLRAFIKGKNGLLFKTRNGTPYLHNNLEQRWLTPRLQAMQIDGKGMGFHAFRRLRKTWLRGKRCPRRRQQLLDGAQTGDNVQLYSRLDEELELRLQEAETVGVGFGVPTYVAPSCSKISVESEVEIAA